MGIDGATFDLFGEWLTDLPTISSIIETGIGSELESSVPPVTSPAWRCYATGKDPSKLNVYWWRQLDRRTHEYVGAPSIPLRSKCYWEYLSEWGDEVAVIGVPLNIPPREVNGRLVLGGPYADPEQYTYPESLQTTLDEEFGYQLHPTTDPPEADEATDPAIVDELEEMIHQRFDVAEWFLQDDPQLLNVTLFYINHLQHMAWKSPEVKHLWEAVDRRLGELIDDETDVIIHSDHGLHEVKQVFYLNAWLESEGYLRLDEERASLSDQIWNAGDRITDRLGIQPLVKRVIPTRISQEMSRSGEGKIINASDYERKIDFDASDAVGLPHGLVYVLADRDSVIDELEDDLRSITAPDSGDRIFRDVTRLEAEYSRWNEAESPDLFCEWESGHEIKDVYPKDASRLFGPPQRFKADNAPMGILLASGPSVSESELTTTPSLYDIAPTVLHLLGRPVPDDMDGTVLGALFKSGSEPDEREVNTIAGSTMEAEGADSSDPVESRLQDLGYLE